MTRTSKKDQLKNCPRKNKKVFAQKSGPKKDNLPEGYRVHVNAVSLKNVFVPKIA